MTDTQSPTTQSPTTQSPTTQSPTTQWLLPLAFLGGLIASVSPCILGLLPINRSYIGTLELKSRRNRQIGILLRHNHWVSAIGSIALALAGTYYVVDGILWFFS
jgi:cytochrome c biogenesis protein CcdA